MLPAVSTVLFPEPYFPEEGTYKMEPIPGQVAAGDADNGAEQVSERRTNPLMTFSWRSLPLEIVDGDIFRTFINTCGSGFVNFTFYPARVKKYSNLLVGYTDGTGELVLPWRNLNSYSGITVDGTPDGGATVANEFVSPTKEDKIFITGTPAASLPIRIQNVYGRQRFICRMLSYRELDYEDGGSVAQEFDPLDPTMPIFLDVFEFNFREKP